MIVSFFHKTSSRQVKNGHIPSLKLFAYLFLLCFIYLNGNLCLAKDNLIQHEESPEFKVERAHESFDSTLYYAYYNLALKNSDKAFRVAKSLYQNATTPREKARALMLMAGVLGKKSEPVSALKHVDKAIELAKENNNNDVLVWALYYKGELNRSLGFFNRGNAMLDQAENLIPKIKNDYWHDKFRTTFIKGEAEMAMAKYEFQKAKKLLIKATSDYQKWASIEPEATAILGRCYQILADCYYNLGSLDKALETYHTAHNHLNQWNTKNTIYTGRLYRGMGNIHLERNDLDSTKTYLLKALSIAEAGNSNSFMKKVYESFKKYYKKTNEMEHFAIYVNKQDSVKRIIDRHNKSMISAMAEYPILASKEGNASSQKTVTTEVKLIFIAFILFVLSSVFYSFKSYKKRKRKENEDLKRRLDASFDELIDFAKNNDPSFLARFKQVHPLLYKKLRSTVSPLTDSEMNLCAMIWLKFSSKEIAKYTFIQHKTVQIKKYRLRKKLALPNGTDLYEWMYSLTEENL